MDGNRFDSLTRAFGAGRSRRSVVKSLGAVALGAVGLRKLGSAEAASNNNSACAHFCNQVFGANTPAASQCASLGAHGTGPCADCANNPANYCNGTCTNVSTDAANCGTCGHACLAGDACNTAVCASGACSTTPNTGASCANGTGACDATGACACPNGGTLCTGSCCPSSCECLSSLNGIFCYSGRLFGGSCQSDADCTIAGNTCHIDDPEDGFGLCKPTSCRNGETCPTGAQCSAGVQCLELCVA